MKFGGLQDYTNIDISNGHWKPYTKEQFLAEIG